MFIRSLDEKELATEDFENMAGEKMEHIFPASEAGQSMRWSRFKDKDSREIFLTMQQRVFPAIKKMKYCQYQYATAKGITCLASPVFPPKRVCYLCRARGPAEANRTAKFG